jgi:hypothetical protein
MFMKKTAARIASSPSGAQMEEMIRKNQMSNPDFAWIQPSSPLHQLYQQELTQLRAASTPQAPPSLTPLPSQPTTPLINFPQVNIFVPQSSSSVAPLQTLDQSAPPKLTSDYQQVAATPAPGYSRGLCLLNFTHSLIIE